MVRTVVHEPIWKPSRAQCLASRGKTIRDVIAPNLLVLFCGINPGLYTAAIGHHFGRPGNRFWPALVAGGFTRELFSPFDERHLLDLRIGITNIVAHATATADEVTPGELRAGAKKLLAKVRRYHPRVLAVVGVGAYRVAFDRPRAALGLQDDTIGATRIWVLPNPSGLNAHYQPRQLGKLFAELRRFAIKKEQHDSRR